MKKNLFLIVMMMWSCGVLFSQETWVKTFGGNSHDGGSDITTTLDGGFVLTGWTTSNDGNDGDFKGMNKGKGDIFIIKLDSRGSVQWKKTFGGSEIDLVYTIVTTPDGGFVLTGETSSNDGDFKGMKKGTSQDIFIIKFDLRGSVQWKKTLGGSHWDTGNSITTTPDGGYVLTGYTFSNDGDFKGMNKGEKDVFIIKLDSKGNLQPSGKKSKKK